MLMYSRALKARNTAVSYPIMPKLALTQVPEQLSNLPKMVPGIMDVVLYKDTRHVA